MTNEEAINVLNDYDINFERSTAEEVAEAHEMAIKALETQPSEDWNAVLDELNRIGRNAFKDDTDYDNLFDFISNLPNVKPQSEKRTEERTETHECDYISRKGYWIEHKHGGIEHIECSKCRCWFLRKDLIRNSYCPNCGSRNHWNWELKTEGEQK